MWDDYLGYVFLEVFFYVETALEDLAGFLLVVVAFDEGEEFLKLFKCFLLAPGGAPVIDPYTVDYLGGVYVVHTTGAVVAEALINSFNLTVKTLFASVGHEICIIKCDFDRV